MKAILICFEALLGLKANFFKSELISVRAGDTDIKVTFGNQIFREKILSFPKVVVSPCLPIIYSCGFG